MAQMRKIRTGVRLIGSIEVLEGLKPGEKVIVEGLQKVVPGAPVRIAAGRWCGNYNRCGKCGSSDGEDGKAGGDGTEG